MQCTHDGCGEKATFHLTHVEARKCIHEEHLCEQHCRELSVQGFLSRGANHGTPSILQGATCFEIDLIIISEINDQQVVYLREVGGERRVPILIGIFEATSLDRRVKGYVAPRPLTHDATAMIIRALGADVRDMVIDRLDTMIYRADVHLQQADRVLTVDIRTSDALMLALVFDCPVYFANGLLGQL